MSALWILLLSLLYLLLLFRIGAYIEKKQEGGQFFVRNAWIYSLSAGVFCTAWTFYGSVGRVMHSGLDFLTIYLGPALVAPFFPFFLRKVILICKQQHITSLSDFFANRFPTSRRIGTLVSLLCLLAITPYIALQIRAIGSSLVFLSGTDLAGWENLAAFLITLVLGVFVWIFGIRSIDAGEKHPGMIGALAFESLFKLLVILLLGFVLLFFIFDGPMAFSRVIRQAGALQKVESMVTNTDRNWLALLVISACSGIFLPRQFQVMVVENQSEKHLRTLSWLFPLYLLLINILVLPLALAGYLFFGESVNADNYVLALPMHWGMYLLALLVFLGGFASATGMIIAETIAMSTMLSNSFLVPLLVKDTSSGKEAVRVLRSRRVVVIFLLLLAYLYAYSLSPELPLVSIGLISFAAVAQLAPGFLMGLFWPQSHGKAVSAGLLAGGMVWAYTLFLPSLEGTFLYPATFYSWMDGIGWLHHEAILGIPFENLLTHSVVWSLGLNVLISFGGSLWMKEDGEEALQAYRFMRVDQPLNDQEIHRVWKGVVHLEDLERLMVNTLGESRANRLLTEYAMRHGKMRSQLMPDAGLVSYVQRVLSGVLGSNSARTLVKAITREEAVQLEELMEVIEESGKVMNLNRELSRKSEELTRMSRQLETAVQQLRATDELKDEFLYTVTHELRTPLTSIRALGEILQDNPDLEEEERNKYTEAIVKETQRLSHLINQVLSLERFESGRQKLNLAPVMLKDLIQSSVQSLEPLMREKNIRFHSRFPDPTLIARVDEDLLKQVMINLLSNAIKFAKPEEGEVFVLLENHFSEEAHIHVMDNGKGIETGVADLIFDKFFQARNQTLKKPEGSGLGLAICKKIIQLHQGRISVQNRKEGGAHFTIQLPLQS